MMLPSLKFLHRPSGTFFSFLVQSRPLHTVRKLSRFFSEHFVNHAEAAHRRLQIQLAFDHPSLWAFIDGLRSVQKRIDSAYEQYVRGDSAPEKRRKYQKADARISNLVASYHTIGPYLNI